MPPSGTKQGAIPTGSLIVGFKLQLLNKTDLDRNPRSRPFAV